MNTGPNYERQRRYERRKAADGADIGELPPVKDPARRQACRLDLHRYLTTYFPYSTGRKPFGPDQRRAIDRQQHTTLQGGRQINLFPRGGCKTSISEGTVLWAQSYGHRRFYPVISATKAEADKIIASVKTELSDNELLYEDFPEICHPIRALEGKSQRCASQTQSVACAACGGVEADDDEDDDAGRCKKCGGAGRIRSLTHIQWKGDTIVLPTIFVPQGWGTIPGPRPGAPLIPAPSSGGIITARGRTAAQRGMKHKRPDGTQQRPDGILIDDPQTTKSASTPLQVKKTIDWIHSDVLRLGGHDRKLGIVINATVIRRHDMADRMADRENFPAWQSERIKMVRQWPGAHATLWLGTEDEAAECYKRIRNQYDPLIVGDQERAHAAATVFYRERRAEMDAGGEVFWEHCFDEENEISAIQHAYNILIDDGPEAFASECQNEPLEEETVEQTQLLSADAIAKKLNRLPRGIVPATATRLVAFIDPKHTLLYYAVVALEEGFGGYIVDYGTFPDQQGRKYFSARDAKITLADFARQDRVKGGLEATLVAGLEACCDQLALREWKRDDGSVIPVDKCLIDRGDGKITLIVDRFCRTSKHKAILMPSQGRYYGATTTPMAEYKKKPGERVGLNWRVPAKGTIRHVYFDTNFWKGFLHDRLAVPVGVTGSFSLFGDEHQRHALLADHFRAEAPVLVQAKGRSVVEFKKKPDGGDEDLFDCVVGCCVAGSMLGVQLDQLKETRTIARRVRLSEIQRARRLGLAPPGAQPPPAATPGKAPAPGPGSAEIAASPAAAEAATPPAPAPAPAPPPARSVRRRVRLSEVQRRRNEGGAG